MELYSLYLHIPFCRHRCSYCDFNTFAGRDRLIPQYVDAICSEIRQVTGSIPDRLKAHTIFFGGGTPSILPVDSLEKILSTISDCFDLRAEGEITLEANPGTVNLRYLQDIQALGINRISFGMQSSHPDDLRLLERQHNHLDVIQAVAWAREADIQNISLDLIFGLPGQSYERWQSILQQADGLSPEHLSLHALTIEHGTPLYKRWGKGLIPLVDEDLAADMYEFGMEYLEQAGFVQYEISNWARSDPEGGLYACTHNMHYWSGLPYFGFGAGAHGFVYGHRSMNIGGIKPYIERCIMGKPIHFPGGPSNRRLIAIDPFTQMQEMMMVGLRLTLTGVSDDDFQARFGKPMTTVFGEEISRLEKTGLIEWIGNNLRLTRRGRMLGNQVFMQFVG